MSASALPPSEKARRNELHQKHQIAQEIASLEDGIRHLRFCINILSQEIMRLEKRIKNLKGRGGS